MFLIKAVSVPWTLLLSVSQGTTVCAFLEFLWRLEGEVLTPPLAQVLGYPGMTALLWEGAERRVLGTGVGGGKNPFLLKLQFGVEEAN